MLRSRSNEAWGMGGNVDVTLVRTLTLMRLITVLMIEMSTTEQR